MYKAIRVVSTLILASRLKPIPLSADNPLRSSIDVSLVIPSLSPFTNLFLDGLKTWVANEPMEIILVVPQRDFKAMAALLRTQPTGNSKVELLTVPTPSKRKQLARGIAVASGCIIVLVDSDVHWPKTLLSSLLAGFQDPRVGGVGSRAKICEDGRAKFQGGWVSRQIMRRRFTARFRHISATLVADGRISCLSGRTAAYRAVIIKDKAFLEAFTNDYWGPGQRLDSGDDTFITSWIQDKGWLAVLQIAPEADIIAFAMPFKSVLRQWIRWTRNSKRSFIRHLMQPKIHWTYGEPRCWIMHVYSTN